MLGVRVGARSPTGFSMETSCGVLFKELQSIWTEIGESEADKDHMLLQLERECLKVYQRQVDEASNAKAQLHQAIAVKEAEFAALVASLGEHNFHSKIDKRVASLKEQLASVTPLLEGLRAKKEERIKQFSDVRLQIEKISVEMAEYMDQSGAAISPINTEENDLSIRKLNEYQAHLRTLQKEKSERLHKVLEYVNEVHSLCGELGLDFRKTVDEVHPSLHETSTEKSTNISNRTLEGLAQTVVKLKAEKKARIHKLQQIAESLFELWNLMDSSKEDRKHFGKLACILGPSEQITYSGLLSLETIEQSQAEVERLKKLKASRMKELVLKRRSELEEICRRGHMEPDMNTAPEKSNALIDSGLVDPSELLANIDEQIVKAKEESISRKEIMGRINKWLVACDEENWLEDYNQDHNRYNAGIGVHLSLKRAEKARVTVIKIPAMVNNLMSRTFAWEDEKGAPFLYDGIRLVAILEEYKLTRQQKEEEKRRHRDQKKLHDLLLTEKESLYGSKPSPKRSNSLSRNPTGYRANVYGYSGFMTPAPRRLSVGSATPELLTPRSYSGRQNGYFKEMRRSSTLNYVALSKEDTSSSFTSISGSEPESPPLC